MGDRRTFDARRHCRCGPPCSLAAVALASPLASRTPARRPRSSSRRRSSRASPRAIADKPVPADYANRARRRSRGSTRCPGASRTRIADERERREFLATVHYEAMRAGLDPQLVLGVIQHESGFKKYAVSIAGARGYMQVMPFWTQADRHARAQPVPPAHQPALRLRDPAPLPRHRERRLLPRARPLQRQPRAARVSERGDGRGRIAIGSTAPVATCVHRESACPTPR